jgi:DNA-directed RNA polymerase II subunit RPB1
MFIEYKMEYNTEEIVNIDKIQFCVFGNDEVKRYSVVNKDPYGINIPETYDSHEPKRGGLIDARLGTTDYQVNCATCGLNSTDCPGHFGHTDLAEPVFHFGFIEHVKNILSCICIRCSKLLIYKNEKEINEILKNRIGKARFDEIKRLTSSITYCQNPDYSCGAPIPSIRIIDSDIQIIAETKVEEGEEGTVISSTGKQKIQEILTAEDCYNILKNVSDADCKIMGFDPKINRPENLIITVFPIPPVAIRPTIRRDAIASKSFEDSMTDKLADIIKRNMILRTNKEKSAMLNEEFKYNDSHHQALQYHIATYFNNETSILQKSEQKTGGRLYKSVSERLKGKQGRVRGNLLGKRTNFSGRTVITSNPDIGIDELGIPLKLAMILTFPEIVTPQNISKLSKLVKNGRDIHPGANYVFPKGNDKRPIDLRYRKKNIKLHYGDKVERHLIDGDYVLYNRQPSLHKLSMMGHRCIILRDPEMTTFGMNVSVTAPYNADYDGDEMNIFVPQNIQSSTELEMIANVRNQIIAPAVSNPKIELKQDTPIGTYLLTRENQDIDSHHASNIIMKIKNGEYNIEKKDDISKTYDIFSQLLPKNLNIVQFDDKGEKKIEIINGKLLKGKLTSGVINKTILTTILDQYGNDAATEFIDNLQRTMLQYLLSNGATVGLKDVILKKEALLKCKDLLKAKRLEVETMITEIENNPDLIEPDILETNMTSLLQSVTGEITKVTMADLNKNNNLFILVDSGAKGKPDQVTGMAAGRGQILLNFARIKKKVNNRTFPHYFQNDDRPEARGYIEPSLFEGLKPIEFFMDAMTGREGLIDTAIKTADSGYIQRRLIKCMEDVAVHYDGTIRNGNNIIIQYLYGDSHLDQVKQKLTLLKSLKMNNEKLKEKFYFNEKEIEQISSKFKLNKNSLQDLNNEYFEELKYFRDLLRTNYRKANIDYRTLDEMYFMPVSFNRIIDNSIYGKESNNDDLDPIYVYESLQYILDQKNTKLVCMSEEEKNNNFSLKVELEKKHKTLFKYGLYEYLSPKRCIYEYKLDKNKFDVVVKEVINSFNKCLVEPGEMVGSVGSQSIGEQTTQMSSVYDTIISCHSKEGNFTGKLGMFIDTLLKQYTNKVEEIGKDSVVLDLEKDYHIVGVNNDGKTSWKRISQVSRHPANGGIVKVTTKTGKKTTATLSHSFLKKTETGIAPILGSKLAVGDRIPIAKYIPEVINPQKTIKIGNKEVDLDWELGWICGIYLADGCFNNNIIKISKIHPVVEKKVNEFCNKMTYKFTTLNYRGEYGPGKDNNIHSKDFRDFLFEHFNTGSFNKEIGTMVYHSNLDFIAGVISGYFDGDGNIESSKQLIRVGSVSEKLIRDINRLLGYFGIFASFYTEKNGKFYCLSVQRKYAKIFENEIRLELDEKREQLELIVDYNNRDNKHSELELVDKIPCVGNLVAQTGKLLKMPGQSRNYGRWAKVESIGRNTLSKYLPLFDEQLKTVELTSTERQQVVTNIDILKKAIYSDVIWDEIVKLEYLDDPKEYVYDFTVPGNDSFMVDDNILVHNTLNTKHSSGAGVSGMQGIPRLNEILRKTENIKTPLMYIYLNTNKQDDKELAYKIGAYLKYTVLKDIVKKIDIVFDSDLEDNYMIDDKILIKGAMNLYGNFNIKPENLPWLYRFEISKEALYEKKLNMLEIKTKFINFWDELSTDKSMNKSYRELIKRIINGCIMTTNDNANKLYVHIRFDISDFDSSILLDIQNMILYSFKLKGIDNINDVAEIDKKLYLNFNKDTGDIESKQEYIITTDGINMNKLRYIKHIDNNRAYNNEINTIYRLYGIEAARKALVKEVNMVFTGGLKLNYHHISILCDVMTNTGEIVSIDRHGFGRMDTDPLAKASFERTVEMLINSAVFGEEDKVQSVSSRLIMGRAIRCGTGFPEILIDTDILENTEYNDNELTTMIKNSIDTLKFNENTLINDIINRTKESNEVDTFMI